MKHLSDFLFAEQTVETVTSQQMLAATNTKLKQGVNE